MNTYLIMEIFFWVFVALLAVAAMSDAWRLTIPNAISMALAGLFAVAVFFHPISVDWPLHLAAMGIAFAVALVLYRFGVMGGGDLKLMTAVALWIGLYDLPQLAIAIAVAGGVFALAIIVLRRLLTGVLVAQGSLTSLALPRLLLPGEPVPYGVAISAGGIWVARGLPHLGGFV
jgi:prepilin peptidase CpaA